MKIGTKFDVGDIVYGTTGIPSIKEFRVLSITISVVVPEVEGEGPKVSIGYALTDNKHVRETYLFATPEDAADYLIKKTEYLPK